MMVLLSLRDPQWICSFEVAVKVVAVALVVGVEAVAEFVAVAMVVVVVVAVAVDANVIAFVLVAISNFTKCNNKPWQRLVEREIHQQNRNTKNNNPLFFRWGHSHKQAPNDYRRNGQQDGVMI
jgi:acyl-[acyl carrier protein]--UDP-N-acetylglucosamine O-acyltransferase